MSGFLRRTKRSRAADTGETSAEELGAGPEGARTAESPAVDASNAKTTELPAGVALADASGPLMANSPSSAAGSDAVGTSSGLTGATDVGAARAARAGPDTTAETDRGGSRPQAVAGPAGAEAAGPVVVADRDTPAGLDPAEAGAKVATGRRGRLRRRLRYLRRARELMLRDLGGLLYEVHRTGGGDVTAHTATIGGKIERLAALDGEAAAIETALGASRGPAVVFEPGIGGTCEICGELYGSAARFCSHCGSPAGATAKAPAPSAEPRPVPAMPKAPAPAASQVSGPATPDDENPDGAATPAAGDEEPPGAATPAAGDEKEPHGGRPNGRAEPGLSPDDPLTAKRSSP